MSTDMPIYHADLQNCDREPIHILGNIQPFGFLIAVNRDWRASRVSANIGRFLDKSPEQLLGLPLEEIFRPAAVHNFRNRLALLRGPDAVERLLGETLVEAGGLFDIAMHFSGETIVFEAEPAAELESEAGNLIRTLTARLRQTSSTTEFLRESARQVKALTGFDRVKVYRFDPEGSGEVVAEAVSSGVDSFLGLHYPSEDIPAQARRLYLRNIFRIIADVDAQPVPLVPALDAEGQPLDQSLSILRAVSPIHIEYLKNMGVSASMSISIVVEGRLWGLFACHHYSPLLPSLATRTAAELYGQMFSLMLESRERAVDAEFESRTRSTIDRMMSSAAQNADLLGDPNWLADAVFDVIPADGIAAHLRGASVFRGLTPTPEQFGPILTMLGKASSHQVFSSDHLQTIHPEAAQYSDIAAGLLAIPLSRAPGDYVVLFRSEQLRSVRWAGNPEKAIEYGPNGPRLTPRKSFEAWSELVKGKALPFTAVELRLAEALRVGMLDVILRLEEKAGEERERASERQELLIAELNHRVRNILALIRGLISQTRDSAPSIELFIDNLEGRIQALARAHDQITKERWAPARLIDLLETETRAYLGLKQSRVALTGTNILLDPNAFTTLALVFHELMTNAVKYGALSDGGSVAVEWRQDEDGSLMLSWTESGGPVVTAPTRRGFGSTIIERAIPHDLGGKAELHYRLNGIRAEFCIPSAHVVGIGKDRPAEGGKPANAAAKKPLAEKSVMLVEDNMIIALDAEDALKLLGASEIEVLSSVAAGLRYLESARPDFAILDFNLGVETSETIAARLIELEIPFLFATGYGEGVQKLSDQGMIVISKPYGAAALAKAAEDLGVTGKRGRS